jgi:hypothetical protein
MDFHVTINGTDDCKYRIGDTDGTGGYLVHGRVVIKTADNKENGSRNEVTSVFFV